MSAPGVSTPGRRCAAAALAVPLAVAGLAAGAAGAGAVSASIAYSCIADGLGAFTLPVVLDTNAPARMLVGQSAQVTLTASAVLPAGRAKLASGTPATAFDGSWVASATFGAAAADVPQTIARTPLGDQTVATAVPFAASATPFTYVAPVTPGVIDVSAGNLAGSLQLYDGSSPAGPAAALTCTVPAGQAPVIDTIAVVATSTTTVALDRTTSEYGQDVTATAVVATTGGIPDGTVAFSVDGLATRATVGPGGVATLVLPYAGPGTHRVSATFVPRDPTSYVGSGSAALPWTVAQARTRIRMPITGRTAASRTRIAARAAGSYGTVPTGTVRITVKRLGTRGKRVRVRTLGDTGTARAGFGRLSTGRYRAVVVYPGDAAHTGVTKTKRFRVKRS